MNIMKDNLTIRYATINDIELLCKWWNDGNIMSHAGFPNGLGITTDEIKYSLLGDSDDTYRHFIVELKALPIGEMSYHNRGNAVAEIGIKICDEDAQNCGYGTILLNMFMNSLFYDYHYEKIILNTNKKNVRAQHFYEKIGFHKLRINLDSWKDQLGVLQSSIDYELSRSDFEKLQKR